MASLLKKKFREEVAKNLFPGNNRSQIQYFCFSYRFDPDNFHLKHIEIALKIAEKEKINFNQEGINATLKEVIKKIHKVFQQKLEGHKITKEQLGLRSQKQQSLPTSRSANHHPWKIIYEWLWEKEYHWWVERYIWDFWKQKGKSNKRWINFTNKERSMVVPVPESHKSPSVPINQALQMEISINFSQKQKYLLLLNRSRDNQNQETKYLVCPSQAFAPNWELSKDLTIMPQPGAICSHIEFDAVGQEEYIGIVLNQELNLHWLMPDPENPAWNWEGIHLAQVWEKLQENDAWQVFYQCFNVS